MGRKSNIRVNPDELPAENPKPLTQKEIDQLTFRNGNRQQKRQVAKRNGFFKDKTGTTWREANRMIREDDTEVRL